MRIVSVPYSLNARTGLVWVPIGDRKMLEKLSIDNLVEKAFSYRLMTRAVVNLFQAHPEPKDATRAMVWKRRARGEIPDDRLVIGLEFFTISIVALTLLEIAHLAFLGTWNNEIFSGIMGLIGTVIGIIIGSKT